jgi:hypothetical protein
MRAIRKVPLIRIPLLGGILFVGMGIRLPIGFHMSWNFTQAAIFSGTGSGVEMPPCVWKAVIEGPERMMGGKFGVEASTGAFLLRTTAGPVLALMAARQRRAGSRCAWQQSRPNKARAAVQTLLVRGKKLGCDATSKGNLRLSIRLIRGTFAKAGTAWGLRRLNLVALQAIFIQTAGQFGKAGTDLLFPL